MKKITMIMLTVAVLSVMALPLIASAQSTELDLGVNDAAEIGLGNSDLKTTINSIIRLILSFLGILAVVIILWGGFIWMTAMGDDGKVDKAKQLILAGIVGVVIILSAYAIASFVINAVNNATRL